MLVFVLAMLMVSVLVQGGVLVLVLVQALVYYYGCWC